MEYYALDNILSNINEERSIKLDIRIDFITELTIILELISVEDDGDAQYIFDFNIYPASRLDVDRLRFRLKSYNLVMDAKYWVFFSPDEMVDTLQLSGVKIAEVKEKHSDELDEFLQRIVREEISDSIPNRITGNDFFVYI